MLDRATDLAKADGVKIEAHGPKGDAASAILAVAEGNDADLIVLGSKGMQGARRVLGQRAEQGVAPGALRPADRSDDVGGRGV